MAVTIHDVARMAGLSVGTVSRYLNGYNLKKENQLRIKQASNKLKFKENLIAKGLKNRHSHTIGVVVWNLSDEFVTSVITAIEQRLETTKYNLILSTYEKGVEKLENKLQILKDRFIDGLILFPQRMYPSVLNEYKKDNIPIILIDEDLKELMADRVMVDNFDSAFKATEMLIRLKHLKIAFVEGKKSYKVNREQLQGYYSAMKQYGITIKSRYVVNGNFSTMKAYHAVKNLMAECDKPTGLIVSTHPMTVGALMALYELNIKIPEELSLIGFGDYGLSSVTRPALSVIDKPTRAMGKKAAELLIRRMEGDYLNFPRLIKFKTKLIVKDSIRELDG